MPEDQNGSRDQAAGPENRKRPYVKPELQQLGHMGDVTRKSGGGVDGGNPNQRAMP